MFKPPVRSQTDGNVPKEREKKPPSGKPVKKLMTQAGYKRLAIEHNELMLVERPKVVQGIATAAAEGDRSENAEYIYGKKRLRELDKRLRYLGFLLKNVRLIDHVVLRGDIVLFGATVTVREEDGKEKRYTIVGEGEAEWRNLEISYKSPVARALLGKRVGDVITAQRPAGEIDLEIVDLHFGERHYTVPPSTDAASLAGEMAPALPSLEELEGCEDDDENSGRGPRDPEDEEPDDSGESFADDE